MTCKEIQKAFNENVQTYHRMRAKHPGAILLFRVDSKTYQAFYEDAVAVSEICHRPLSRGYVSPQEPVELSWFDSSDLDTYLPKLVRAGKRVAICEHIEDPKLSKSQVKRSVYQPQK